MQDHLHSNQTLNIEARAAIDGYIVLGILCGIPVFCASIVILVHPNLFLDWLPVLASGLVLMGFLFTWLLSFKLRITDGEISYSTLFSGTSQITLDDISLMRHVFDHTPRSYKIRPQHRLEIYTNASLLTPVLCINLKVFSHQVVNNLLKFSEAKGKFEMGRVKRGRRKKGSE